MTSGPTTTSELGPSARALIEAARGGGPDAAAIARMRGKIDAAVAPAAVATTSTAVGSSLAGKLGLVVLALVIAGGAAIFATRSRATESHVATFESSDPVVAPTLRTVREAAPSPVNETALIELEPPAPSASRGTPVVAAKVAKPEPARVTLAREVELVDQAMTALRRGEPRAALTAVRHHGQETAYRGQLAEDATAIEIEALCMLRDRSAAAGRGSTEFNAAARLSAFDARWPASAQRARLTKACATR